MKCTKKPKIIQPLTQSVTEIVKSMHHYPKLSVKEFHEQLSFASGNRFANTKATHQ